MVSEQQHLAIALGTTLGKGIFKPYSDIKSKVKGLLKLREVSRISKYFKNYYEPVTASVGEILEPAHLIRSEVFCDELKLFNRPVNGLEIDMYDDFAMNSVLRHKRTGVFAGTVRLITPQHAGQVLPVVKYGLADMTRPELHPDCFDRNDVCEISRIAIPKGFRRRKNDQFDGAETGAINTNTYSDIELRCFPLIAVGLYMTVAAMAISAGKRHAYVMVEPRLARSMRFVGINFIPISQPFEYVGTRVSYYINNDGFLRNLTKEFRVMMEHIMEQIDHQ